MAFPVILSKLKALTPVGVVGLAVAVTIKLLTQATPTNSQLLQVKADEDIMQVEEQPEEEKEEEEEASDPVQEAEEAEVEEDIPEEEEQGDDSGEEQDNEEKEQEKSKQEEDKKSENRAFKGSGPVIDIFKALLSPEQ